MEPTKGITVPFKHQVVNSSAYRIDEFKSYGIHDDLYSGFIPIKGAATVVEENHEGSLFFWLAKQRSKSLKSNKLIIWLNGGPGCSSMVGMMLEHGPFSVHFNDDSISSGDQISTNRRRFKLISNEYSWNVAANVLYVEQPIRTGFSIATSDAPIIRSEAQIAQDFHNFLLSFFKIFPELATAEVSITGESYAGFYVPWIAEHIVRTQSKAETSPEFDVYKKNLINLKGAAIGNGVMDYFHQEPSYAEYAYTHGLIPLGAKQKFDSDWQDCVEKVEASSKKLTRGSFDKCHMMSKVLGAAGNPNEYNTATFQAYPFISSDDVFTQFFNDPHIQTIIHVRGNNIPGINFQTIKSKTNSENYYEPPNGWQVCNDDINSQMTADHPVTAVPTLKYLTENGIRVMLYSGEFDMNCNTLGTLHTLEANHWLGQPWSHAKRYLWKFNGDVAGEYFSINELMTFLIVRNSGHLFPMDLPAIALDMITRFVDHSSFRDVELPNEESYIISLLSKDIISQSTNDSLRYGSSASVESSLVFGGMRYLSWFITFFAVLFVGIVIGIQYGKKLSSSNHNSNFPSFMILKRDKYTRLPLINKNDETSNQVKVNQSSHDFNERSYGGYQDTRDVCDGDDYNEALP
eukprot:gene4454-6299_t